MPKNKLMYFGVLVVVASALLWIGIEAGKRIEFFLPWAGGAGILMLVAGVFVEAANNKKVLLSVGSIQGSAETPAVPPEPVAESDPTPESAPTPEIPTVETTSGEQHENGNYPS